MKLVWLTIIASIYLAALIFCASYASKRARKNSREFLTAGNTVSAVLGLLTFSATLFSTFTLMGMPDLVRRCGIGAWIFLGVTDVAMAFLTLWFGVQLHKRLAELDQPFTNVGSLLSQAYRTQAAALVYSVGVFLFLIPYVSIQIKGVALFLTAAVPGQISFMWWAALVLVLMCLYSYAGGLRAIMYSDAIQGLLLLIVTWLIGIACVKHCGGINSLLEQVSHTDVALLSTPGPEPLQLFSRWFLISSFVAIVTMPLCQPQLVARIGVLRNVTELKKMSVGIAVFAFLAILPTVPIGLYGAVTYTTQTDPVDILVKTMVHELPIYTGHFGYCVGALGIVGLAAAAMSTADSQIFAMGTESMAILPKSSPRQVLYTKTVMFLFAVISFIFSVQEIDQLALFARKGFAGTSLLAPMVVVAILVPGRANRFVPFATAIALIAWGMALMGFFPSVFPLSLTLWKEQIGAIPFEFVLFVGITAATAAAVLCSANKG